MFDDNDRFRPRLCIISQVGYLDDGRWTHNRSILFLMDVEPIFRTRSAQTSRSKLCAIDWVSEEDESTSDLCV